MLLSFNFEMQVFEPGIKMKKSKIIFVNRSKIVLHVQCSRSGSSDLDSFEVLNRKVLRLFPGQYEITACYEGRAVLISSKSIDSGDITEVSSPYNPKFTARKIALNVAERNVRLIFREQISVGSILDGSANKGI